MRVSKSSWHYRLNRKVYGEDGFWTPPRSLCPYFWRTVFSAVYYCIILPAGCILSLLVAGSLLFDVFASFLHDFERSTLISLTIAFGCATGLSAVFTAHYAWFRRRIRIVPKPRAPSEPKPAKAPKPPREPGLILSYLKAVKAKACPLIEYVGGKGA